jgi:uncharacterized tellurite resistance protein B-like protein
MQPHDAAATQPASGAATPSAPYVPPSPAADTQTVREIVAQLDAMPADKARFLAAFAYVLSRAAEADLSISDAESREMERIVIEHGNIPEAQAVIVVQIAKTRSVLFGATEDYLVTREFAKIATVDERLDLLRCCFLVSVVDDTITSEESGTLMAIAEELGIEEPQVRQLRSEYAEKFAALQAMRQRTAQAQAESPSQ